jgi:hypothetical protein
MSNTNEKKLLAIGIESVNIFTELHQNASVSTGSNTAKLRGKGHAGSSIVIDCAITNKRIGLLLLDNVTDSFAIAVADKADYDTADSTVLPISKLNTHTVLEYMEANFHK